MEHGSDRLSRAASAIWKFNEHTWMDYEMDGSGDCGPLIAKAHQTSRVAILEEHGFTPEAYNEALNERLDSKWLYFSGLEVQPMDEWLDDNTFVYTGAGEYSSLSYLKGGR